MNKNRKLAIKASCACLAGLGLAWYGYGFAQTRATNTIRTTLAKSLDDLSDRSPLASAHSEEEARLSLASKQCDKLIERYQVNELQTKPVACTCVFLLHAHIVVRITWLHEYN